MTASELISCTLAAEFSGGVRLWRVAVPKGCSVQELIDRVRTSSAAQVAPTNEWNRMPVGIWGRKVERGQLLRTGDRVELYRPLLADPRAQRRRRVAAMAKGGKHPTGL